MEAMGIEPIFPIRRQQASRPIMERMGIEPMRDQGLPIN
jgi:hypothetical protein